MTDTEKAALEKRIDELCAEVERLRADQAHWELGNCPSCPNVADLQEALEQNAKLRDMMYEHAHVYAIQNMTEDELRITATNVMEDNAKLRELVLDMWRLLYDWLFKAHEVPYDELKAVSDRMCELGIEVPS